MSAVAALQAELAGLLQRRRAIDTDPAACQRAARIAAGNDRLSPAEQIEIYREQFWLRHTSCLLDDFEGLGGLLAQADWERLVEEYLAAHPPTSFSLRDLGDRMPEFVERSTWLPHHDLCVDLTRVEWAYIEVFDAADAAPLDPGELALIPEHAWENARLVLNPALRLLRVRYPVAALRRDVRLKRAVEIPEPCPQNLVVYRGLDRDLHHELVGDAQFALLEALHEGRALVAAAARAVSQVPGEEELLERELSAWFTTWAARAWIVRVEL